MLLALAVSLIAAAPPPQGLTIRVPRPSSFGATAAEAEVVQRAVTTELEAEGYAVVTGPEDKRISAVVSGTLTKVGAGFILNLSIIRHRDGRVLDQVREEARSLGDLERASADIARHLASALRLAMGARARLKVR